MNKTQQNKVLIEHKTQIILDVLKRRVDKDYGWSNPPLRYDLDIFFLQCPVFTQPLPMLDNTAWPATQKNCQLKAFGKLFTHPVRVCITDADNLYAEYAHPYRLSHIVNQFSNALMSYNDEIDEIDDPDCLYTEYVENNPDDVEKVIYQFAYFLASLTGDTDGNLAARFFMQLSLLKRCEPRTETLMLAPVSDNPLIGKQVLAWWMLQNAVPTKDLLFHITCQGRTLDTVEDAVAAFTAKGSEQVIIEDVAAIDWNIATLSGIRLSVLVACVTQRIHAMPLGADQCAAHLVFTDKIAEGLTKGTLYPVTHGKYIDSWFLR